MKFENRERKFVFTYFIIEKNIELLSLMIGDKYDSFNISYIGFGVETCPTTNKTHLQGVCVFKNAIKNPKRILVKLGFENTIHIEIMKGNFLQAKDYCKKEGKYKCYGNEPAIQGARTDLEFVRSMCHRNVPLKTIVSECSSFQAIKMAETLKKYMDVPRAIKKINVFWFWGESGTGKSRYAYDNFEDIFRPISEKWWDGYDGHKTVLLDDLRPEFCSFVRLLQLTDIYPIRVECKGGSRQAQYDTIIITAPTHHKKMWENETKEDLYQLTRRITKETKFDTKEYMGNTNHILTF